MHVYIFLAVIYPSSWRVKRAIKEKDKKRDALKIEAKAHRHHRRHDQPRILENKKNSYKKTSKKQREGTELGKTLCTRRQNA